MPNHEALLPVTYVLHKMRVALSVGIHPHEIAPQDLIVSVRAQGLAPARPGNIAAALDYEPIRTYVQQNWPRRAHTDLLETLALDLFGEIFADARVLSAEISMLKPDAFPETELAGIEIKLTREAWLALQE
ncbi:MAG: dihydroneopterin aldolase [Alphaproteobacteria bacterium]